MEREQVYAVRRKLYILYLMNITDWICTVALIGTGCFYEANPLMRQVADSIPLGFVVKALVPAAAVALVLTLTGRMDNRGVLTVDRFTTLVLLFYTTLVLNHIINFILYFTGVVLCY